MSVRELVREKVSAADLLHVMVHRPLRESLRDNIYRPLRTELLGPDGCRTDIAGFEQYDLWTMAFLDICRSTGFRDHLQGEDRQLDHWLTLVRAASWWWPEQHRCVLTERPISVHTEPVPGAKYGQVRLHRDDGPAVEFAGGATLPAVHGVTGATDPARGPAASATTRSAPGRGGGSGAAGRGRAPQWRGGR